MYSMALQPLLVYHMDFQPYFVFQAVVAAYIYSMALWLYMAGISVIQCCLVNFSAIILSPSALLCTITPPHMDFLC